MRYSGWVAGKAILVWSASTMAAFLFCHGITTAQTVKPFTTLVEQCILPASQYQSVNPHVLRAILAVESNLKPGAIGRNANGTIDVGMGQMNSIHFKDLAKYGIAPEHLTDPCVATYVTAWHLKKLILQHGNTWEGIARYHSGTPTFNQRYQVLLRNELVRSGAITGILLEQQPRLATTEQKSPSGDSLTILDISN